MSKQRITQYAGLAASENSVRRSQRSTAVSPDAIHQRQLIGESLTLSLNDSAIFLRFFRAIDNLDRLPRCNMQVLAGTEDPVQHAAYGA